MKKIINYKNIFWITIVTLLALTAGFAGGILFNYIDTAAYLAYQDYSYLDQAAKSGFYPKKEDKKVSVEYKDLAPTIAETVSDSLVAIFRKSDLIIFNQGETDESKYYDYTRPLAVGSAITSDGWIITAADIKEEDFGQYNIITKDKKIYEIDQYLSDKHTKLKYLHIQAKSLPVKRFLSFDEIKNGQDVILVGWQEVVWPEKIVAAAPSSPKVLASESVSDYLKLDASIPKDFYSAVAYNLNGDCLGFVDEKGMVRPVYALEGPIKNLLKKGKPSYAYLGINYLNTFYLIEAQTVPQEKASGALISAGEGEAVAGNSPAQKAGLQEGDLIYAIDGIELTEKLNLRELIRKYLPGDKIIVDYFRDKEKKKAEIVLGEI